MTSAAPGKHIGLAGPDRRHFPAIMLKGVLKSKNQQNNSYQQQEAVVMSMRQFAFEYDYKQNMGNAYVYWHKVN